MRDFCGWVGRSVGPAFGVRKTGNRALKSGKFGDAGCFLSVWLGTLNFFGGLGDAVAGESSSEKGLWIGVAGALGESPRMRPWQVSAC